MFKGSLKLAVYALILATVFFTLAFAVFADRITGNNLQLVSVDEKFKEIALYNCFSLDCTVFLNITDLAGEDRSLDFTASFIPEWTVDGIDVWQYNNSLGRNVWETVKFKQNGISYKGRSHNNAKDFVLPVSQTKTFRIKYKANTRVLDRLVKFDFVVREPPAFTLFGLLKGPETVLDPLINATHFELCPKASSPGCTATDINVSLTNISLSTFGNVTLNGTIADAINDTNTLLLCRFNDSTTCVDGETPSTAEGITFGGGIIGSSFLQNMKTRNNLTYATTNNVILENMTVTFWFNRTADNDENLGRMFEITDGTNTNLIQIRLAVHAAGGIIPFFNIGNKTGGLMNQNSICSGVQDDNFNKTGWKFFSFKINKDAWRCGMASKNASGGFTSMTFSSVTVTSPRDEGNIGGMEIRIAGSKAGWLNSTIDDLRISKKIESDEYIEDLFNERETYFTSSWFQTQVISLSANRTKFKLNTSSETPANTIIKYNVSCDGGQNWIVNPAQNTFTACPSNSTTKDKYIVAVFLNSTDQLATAKLNGTKGVVLDFQEQEFVCPT